MALASLETAQTQIWRNTPVRSLLLLTCHPSCLFSSCYAIIQPHAFVEQAVRTVLSKTHFPVKIQLRMTDECITLVTSLSSGKIAGSFSIPEMRCFSRHRDGRSGKPKFISLVAVNKYNVDPSRPFQCFMIRFNTTAEADSFCYMLNYVCQTLHREQTAALAPQPTQPTQQHVQQQQPKYEYSFASGFTSTSKADSYEPQDPFAPSVPSSTFSLTQSSPASKTAGLGFAQKGSTYRPSNRYSEIKSSPAQATSPHRPNNTHSAPPVRIGWE